MIQEGMRHTVCMTVTQDKTAESLGSGDLCVLATPALVALMENAAMLSVAQVLDHDSTTVGGQIDVLHTKPSGLGAVIKATAIVTKVEASKIVFKIVATEGETVIGEATHVRFVVDRERFMRKIEQRNSK